jgi:hypothetical protein
VERRPAEELDAAKTMGVSKEQLQKMAMAEVAEEGQSAKRETFKVKEKPAKKRKAMKARKPPPEPDPVVEPEAPAEEVSEEAPVEEASAEPSIEDMLKKSGGRWGKPDRARRKRKAKAPEEEVERLTKSSADDLLASLRSSGSRKKKPTGGQGRTARSAIESILSSSGQRSLKSPAEGDTLLDLPEDVTKGRPKKKAPAPKPEPEAVIEPEPEPAPEPEAVIEPEPEPAPEPAPEPEPTSTLRVKRRRRRRRKAVDEADPTVDVDELPVPAVIPSPSASEDDEDAATVMMVRPTPTPRAPEPEVPAPEPEVAESPAPKLPLMQKGASVASPAAKVQTIQLTLGEGGPLLEALVPEDANLAVACTWLHGALLPVETSLDGRLLAGWRLGTAIAPLPAWQSVADCEQPFTLHRVTSKARAVKIRVDGEASVLSMKVATVVQLGALIELVGKHQGVDFSGAWLYYGEQAFPHEALVDELPDDVLVLKA